MDEWMDGGWMVGGWMVGGWMVGGWMVGGWMVDGWCVDGGWMDGWIERRKKGREGERGEGREELGWRDGGVGLSE